MAAISFLKKKPGLSLLLGLECFLFLIVSYQIQVDGRLSLLEKMGLVVFGPVQELNNSAVGSVSTMFQKKRTRAQLEEENRNLRKALAGYHELRTQLVETEMENDRLRDILDLPPHDSWTYIPARVIGRTHRRNDYMITVNKGSRQGVQTDYGVYSSQGVVGIVWETSGEYCKIMTVNNPGSVVAALVQDSRYQECFVSGLGGMRGRIENFPNFEPIKVSDLVLTSGLDGIFPKALPIGRVVRFERSAYTFQDVELRFTTDFARLEEVIIMAPRCPEDEHENP